MVMAESPLFAETTGFSAYIDGSGIQSTSLCRSQQVGWTLKCLKPFSMTNTQRRSWAYMEPSMTLGARCEACLDLRALPQLNQVSPRRMRLREAVTSRQECAREIAYIAGNTTALCSSTRPTATSLTQCRLLLIQSKPQSRRRAVTAMEHNPYSPPTTPVADIHGDSVIDNREVLIACKLFWVSFGLSLVGTASDVLRQSAIPLVIGGLIGAAVGFAITRWIVSKLKAGRNWMRL